MCLYVYALTSQVLSHIISSFPVSYVLEEVIEPLPAERVARRVAAFAHPGIKDAVAGFFIVQE